MNTDQTTSAYWENWLATAIAKEIGERVERIDISAPFSSFELDSIITVTLAADLEKASGKVVEPTVFWEFPDIKSLAAWVIAK